MRGDKDVVLEALANNVGAGLFMSDQLREDKSFFLEAVQMNGEVLAWATNSVLGDREVALAAVQQTPQVVEKAGFFLHEKKLILRVIHCFHCIRH